MEELSTCPNVMVKLSGLTMPSTGFRFETRAEPPTSEEVATKLGPWYNFVLEKFGVDRCMFCSNFPVDKSSCSYGVLCLLRTTQCHPNPSQDILCPICLGAIYDAFIARVGTMPSSGLLRICRLRTRRSCSTGMRRVCTG